MISRRDSAQRRREKLALLFWAILSGSVIATLVGLLAGAMLWGLVHGLSP